MNKKLGKRLEKYLSQVDRYLIHMPVSEKTDILSELKSSFYERLNNGQREEDILAEMEPAKVVALNYMGASIVQNKEFSFTIHESIRILFVCLDALDFDYSNACGFSGII